MLVMLKKGHRRRARGRGKTGLTGSLMPPEMLGFGETALTLSAVVEERDGERGL